MKTYCISLFVVSNVEEMHAESLSYCVHVLSNILFTAGFTSYAVREVGDFATYVVFARLLFAIVVHWN